MTSSFAGRGTGWTVTALLPLGGGLNQAGDMFPGQLGTVPNIAFGIITIHDNASDI